MANGSCDTLAAVAATLLKLIRENEIKSIQRTKVT